MAAPQQRRATTTSLPSPIGGWNARDSLAAMSPTDAVQMVNFYPTPTDVQLRKGYTKYSTGILGSVNTLMNYADSNSQKLFAAAGSQIYYADAGPAVVKVTGLSNDKFQHINITTSGGHFLVACNGADPTLVYNGTDWVKIATTGTGATISSITHVGAVATLTTSTPHGLITGNQVTVSGATPADYNGTYVITVTGASTFTYTMATTPASNATVVGTYLPLGIYGGTTGGTTYTIDSNKFINVNLFKNRLYFTEKDSMRVWYLPVDSIGGAAFPLDFGGIARNGGFIQGMATWTLDAGQGADDYAVFVTNMGEVIVYNGTDPTDATTWQLKGVWQLGQTFNRRFYYKFAGDILLLTQDGLVPLASALQSSRLDPRVNLTDKIYYAVSQAATQFYNNFGWQINYFASENMLILNIPTNSGNEQYVMHTITKSWGRFTGINAHCWEVHDRSGMFFGSDGFVGQFYDAFDDAGSNIVGTVQQAYSYFDAVGQLKRFTMVRPILQTDNGLPTVLCGLSVDFDTEPLTNQIAFNPSIIKTGKWDVSKWDQANWGGTLTTTKIWQGVTGLGYAGSVNLNVASQGIEFHWASTDYVMERGGVL